MNTANKSSRRQLSTHPRLALSVALPMLVGCLVGCQVTPRNGQVMSKPNDVVHFSGFVTAVNNPVQLQFRDQTQSNRWLTFANVTSTNTTETDATGQVWYPYSGDLTLPFGRFGTLYWKGTSSVGSQRRILTETRSYGGNGLAALNTFDIDDDDCMKANESSGGIGIIRACNSEAEFSAGLLLNCGKRGQACCLASGIATTASCDNGSLCDTSTNLCNLPVGGINQPCIVDGQACTATAPAGHKLACLPDPAAPWPATGMCRDVTIERAPVLTSEVVIHTCDVTNANSASAKWIALSSNYTYGTSYYKKSIPMHHVFWLDHAGTDTARNGTDTYGLHIDGIETLGNINSLVIGIDGDNANDAWCFDKVSLIVNGQQVFSKSINGGITLDRDSNVLKATVATKDELRVAFAALNRATQCGLPTGFSYSQISRQVEGVMGDMITRATLGDEDAVENAHKYKLWWGDGGVTVSKANSGAAGIRVQFRMQERSSGFEATSVVKLQSQMSCDWNLWEGQSILGVMFPPILDCSTDFKSPMVFSSVDVDADTILPIAKQLVEGFGAKAVAGAVIDALDSFVGFGSLFDGAEAVACTKLSSKEVPLCDRDNELCGCPNINFGTNGITMSWKDFGVYGFDIDSPPAPPDPLCLR